MQFRNLMLAGALLTNAAFGADPQTSFRFSFAPGLQQQGFTSVAGNDWYKKGSEKPWGFEDLPQTKDNIQTQAMGLTSDNKPFYFSVAVPEGNYKVTVVAGDVNSETDLTIKAELRRLMVEHMKIAKGETRTVSFIVNVRTPVYPGGKVSLKAPRETTDEAWAWDEKLTLEFNGHPNVTSVQIEKADVPTVYLVGDSTMCDQSKEPWNSWGQMFPRFFKDDIAIANHAESGETVASSLGAHRFDKVWSLMKKGDYLFFAFGHNDMKNGNINAYIANYHRVIQTTREKGGIPVVVSSMERMSGLTDNTLQGYPDAAEQVAREEKVAFIDLHAMSQKLYQGVGKADLHLLFSYANGKQDGTHNNDFGSYEISKLVLESIRQKKLDLVDHIKPDVPVFDPAHPDKPAEFKVPYSAFWDGTRPLGD
jgi:lysophospholipase L1-like esterase